MNRIRQKLNDRWGLFLPGACLVILLAGLSFARQAMAVRPTQAACGSQGGCGSCGVQGKLKEVGQLSVAQFAVRQRIERTYGRDAAIQFNKPEAVGTEIKVQVVVNGEVHKTFLVDQKGNVREAFPSPLPPERNKSSARKETKP